MLNIPEETQVLVIGGGPGGATAATLLAREGFEVTLLEAARFPRYHIGESLLPSILQVMDLMGAREKMEAAGFQRKHGAYLMWGDESWPLNFGELSGDNTYAFQVTRAEFDAFMLDHARSQGVQVFEGVEVRDVEFDGERPVSAGWLAKVGHGADTGRQGTTRFTYLIDGSGRDGLLANHYLRNRRYHKVFQNIAVWGYYKDANRLPGSRSGDIAVGSIPAGWLWGIPLSDGTMSVGAVLHRDHMKARRGCGLEDILLEAIDESPLIKDLVAPGELISEVKTETDYSYASERFCGPGYFMIGDAAAFLDPLLSSGVHLATFSAMLAAAGLNSFDRGEVSETEMLGLLRRQLPPGVPALPRLPIGVLRRRPRPGRLLLGGPAPDPGGRQRARPEAGLPEAGDRLDRPVRRAERHPQLLDGRDVPAHRRKPELPQRQGSPGRAGESRTARSPTTTPASSPPSRACLPSTKPTPSAGCTWPPSPTCTWPAPRADPGEPARIHWRRITGTESMARNQSVLGSCLSRQAASAIFRVQHKGEELAAGSTSFIPHSAPSDGGRRKYDADCGAWRMKRHTRRSE